MGPNKDFPRRGVGRIAVFCTVSTHSRSCVVVLLTATTVEAVVVQYFHQGPSHRGFLRLAEKHLNNFYCVSKYCLTNILKPFISITRRYSILSMG